VPRSILSIALCVLATACGGAGSETKVAATRRAPPPPRPKPVNTTFQYEPEQVVGTALVPSALSRAPMPGVAELGKHPPKLERVRRLVASQAKRPPARRADEVHILVALLWADAQGKRDADAKPLMGCVRTAPRTTATKATAT